MRVIRPAHLAERSGWRRLGPALGLFTGSALIGLMLPALGAVAAAATVVLGLLAAIGLGVGAAWLWRATRPDPERRLLRDLELLLANAFDDAYTLIVSPRLPLRRRGLAGLLVGPAGVRVLVARDWDGRYRVRGRSWHYDGGTHGWVACRTNPSFDAAAVAERVGRWASEAGMAGLPIVGAIAFPSRRSRIVLEEPSDEIVTRDNVPWWANRIGRVQRLDAASAERFVATVLDAAEQPGRAAAPARG